MFAVFGKSLRKERDRKNLMYSPEYYFQRNRDAYQISPDYSDESKCWEFIELAKKQAKSDVCILPDLSITREKESM